MGLYDNIGQVNQTTRPDPEPEMPPATPKPKPDKNFDYDKYEQTTTAVTPEPVKSGEVITKSNLILIGTTCYKTILVRTANSIWDTLKKYPNTEHAFQSGVFVHENQNNLVELAREKGASHLFMVEHDNVFEPDTLGRLLAHDKDVIAAPYSGRKLPREPLVYQQNNPGEEPYMMSYDIFPDKLFKAYGVPTGCTLIKMSVFDKLTKPYFFFEYDKQGKMLMSQDIYFSRKVNKANMECWVDPTISVVHIGSCDY